MSLENKLEAILFLENRLVEGKRLAALTRGSIVEIEEAILALNSRYRDSGSIYRIKRLEDSFQLSLSDQFRDPVLEPYGNRKRKLSKAFLETLAIIAYKQPITKMEVDDIRGVNCSHYIRGLLEDDFIVFAGKKEAPGKPNMYKTTSKFLIHFGLESLKDLPTMKEIKTYDFLEEADFNARDEDDDDFEEEFEEESEEELKENSTVGTAPSETVVPEKEEGLPSGRQETPSSTGENQPSAVDESDGGLPSQRASDEEKPEENFPPVDHPR